MRLTGLVLLGLLWPVVVPASEPLGVRVGDHPGFGRVVFDWAAAPEYTAEAGEGRLTLRFPADAAAAVAAVRRPPRNVAGLSATGAVVEITLLPGARARHYRLGARVVVDVADPGPARRVAPVAPATVARTGVDEAPRNGERAQPPARGRARLTQRATVVPPAPSAPEAEQGSGSPVPATPVAPPAFAAVPIPASAAPPSPPEIVPPPPAPTSAAVPLAAGPPPAGALLARLLSPVNEVPSALLPFPADTGAAALRRGGLLLAVFDRAQPLDLAGLRRDPGLAGLEATVLADATLLTLALPPPAALRLRLRRGSWQLDIHRPDPARAIEADARPLRFEAAEGAGELSAAVSRPGRSVVIGDPETGLPLLVGTVRDGQQATTSGRRLPDLDVLPTSLGMAVLARSESVALRSAADRFRLAGAGELRLTIDPASSPGVAAPMLSRLFDLPTAPPVQLLEALRAQAAGIAAAAPLRRAPLRADAAATLLALGLAPEAQSMVRLAQTEDPRAAEDARLGALGGAAAVLAGRPAEAGGLRHGGLPESDELGLWRGLLAAAQEDVVGAGPAIAAALPVLLGYPEGLRTRLLPMAALALASAGEGPAFQQLQAAAGAGADLRLGEAMLAEAGGQAEAALAGYAGVAEGRDRLARARAIRRGVELALREGRIDAAEAARRLEAALFAWRGDGQEIGTRVRLAELRREGGDAAGALALLRETAVMAPERAAALRPALEAAFLAAMQQATPLAAVALFDAYPELLPADPRREAASLLLADRLLALDLPERAAALLREALERAGVPGRAAIGTRLASILYDTGDAEGAAGALARSAVADPPEPLRVERALLGARAAARLGRAAEAQAALLTLGAAGAEPLADLLLAAGDPAGAAAALAPRLAALPEGALAAEDARTVLRAAALLALAGDGRGTGALRAQFAGRLPAGGMAAALTVLTADPRLGLADLPRLQEELKLFREFPVRLESLRTVAAVAR